MDEPAIDPPSTADLPDETPAPLELGELDALALPRSVAALPAALPLPARKAQPQAEYELVGGPAPKLVDAPVPEEAAEVDAATLPAWMRGGLERGPLKGGEAAVGAAESVGVAPPDW